MINQQPGLSRRAKANKIDLVIVGPEQPLVDGLVDLLLAAGLNAFGPTMVCLGFSFPLLPLRFCL
jgi:phosphoribosylamine--glycine ligase